MQKNQIYVSFMVQGKRHPTNDSASASYPEARYFPSIGSRGMAKRKKDENFIMGSRHHFPDRAAGGHRRSETDLLIGVCFEFPKARLVRAFSMKECVL
jgi:hypothetical protein